MDNPRAPERGEVLLCKFPFGESPFRPGPNPHFCLVVDSFDFMSQTWVAVAYGTSRNDPALQSKHPFIFDIRSDAVIGAQLSAPVTHILCDRLAVLPWSNRWFRADVRAHLNIDPLDREKSLSVKRLQDDWKSAQKKLDANLHAALKDWIKNPMAGLVSGITLR